MHYLCRPPGPTSWSPLGIAAPFRRDPLAYLTGAARKYGDLVALPGPLYRPIFLVHDPDLIRQVLVRQADRFIKPPPLNRVLMSTFGNGLLFSEGDFWRRQRRLVQPAFHHQRIGAYAERMVAQTQQMLATWRDGEQRYIDQAMRALTLHVVVDAVFHAGIGTATGRIEEAMAVAGLVLAEQTFNPLKAALPDWLPLPFLRRKRRAMAVLDEIVYHMIAERRQSGIDSGDLISMFLLAEDEETGARMSDRQVRDEVATLFIAGHETTALALSWAWVLLAQHPQVEARLHAEVDQVLGQRSPSLADLPNLVYTGMIIKEALRLYPPVWLMVRQATDDVELGGCRVRPGEMIMIAPYVVHRDPRIYDEPEAFRPERFAPDASGQPLEKRLPRFAYFPFGGGPRVCLGNGFAMLEATLVLATIAQTFKLVLLPGQRVEPAALLTLAFTNRVPMQIVARR